MKNDGVPPCGNTPKAPLCKGSCQRKLTEGLTRARHQTIPPSALRADTSLYTREAFERGRYSNKGVG